ncbi:MAG: hypothetical protein EB127_31005, partial [Alphaproteobacteria bacterium]|nr:hypothetical protein [Alphaproteobacteria bacterium]
MGTDIHTYVERKVDNVWIMVPEEYGPTDPYSGRNRWSLDRSYLLFSILGGVRGDLDPIIKVRGCPVDISKEVFDSFSSWGKEAHSHSYYLLSELLNGKKLSYFEEYLVNLAEWKEYKKGNKDLSGIYYG